MCNLFLFLACSTSCTIGHIHTIIHVQCTCSPSLSLPSSLPYLCTSILTDSASLSADGLSYPLGGFSRYTTGYQNLTSAPSLST